MKVRTVGLLATVAMTLTSATVWSVTPPGGFFEQLREEARASGMAAPEITIDAWRFTDGSTIMVEGRLGHEVIGTDRDHETFLFVRANAPAGQLATQSAALDLAIVIDKSGSMVGKRLQNAVDAARGMVGRLRDGDSLSIVTYNTETQTILPSTTIDARSRQDALRALDQVTAGGDTCISCGLEAGMQALQSRPGAIKRMLLLSDGEATAGIRDVSGFQRLADRAREMGCSITTVGVDVDYNQRIMSALAVGSNGRHHFVENAGGLASIFDDELRSLTATVATDAEIRVSLAPGVQLLEVVDRVFRREGNDLVVPVGSFTAGEEKTLLVRVRVPRSEDGLRDVASVDLRFDDLVSGQRGSCRCDLLTSVSSDPRAVTPLDPEVGARLGRAETASTLRDANQLFERGEAEAARARLAEARQRLAGKKNDLASRAAPKAKPMIVDDLNRQMATLEQADEGFASPPSAAPPQASRGGRSQVRANQAAADEMAF
jgi:Ca-activated chloride channel homolog